LKTLLQESRTSFTKLAKECHISVGAVRMRYKRMWKDGIINGEIMLVNPHCLGYKYIVDLGISTAVENEKDVMHFLKTKLYIRHISGPLGRYNFWTKVALNDVKKLAGILGDLQTNPHIERVDAMIWAEAANVEYAENLVIGPQSEHETKKPAEKPPANLDPIEMDELDKKIASTLSRSSRTPFRRIAAEVGISTKSVIQRYKRLKGNVLSLSTITVNLNNLGYGSYAMMFFKAANRSKIPEICARLVQIPNMIVMIKLIGIYDLYACVAVSDFQEYFKLMEQIRRIPGIEKTETTLTPIFPAWPLHLFPSLIESELMEPKSWIGSSSSSNKHS
jgi:Lrp/AsnC family transcriptional regulator for asnA, asnC and gidA